MVARLATPPPPPTEVRTPPTPRYGYYEDSKAPYTPRKSARVSLRSSGSTQTPSPGSSPYNLRGTSSSASSKVGASDGIADSPSITIAKKRMARSSLAGDSRKVSGALNDESTDSAAVALGLSPKNSESKIASFQPTTMARKSGMLPTPSKTPPKAPVKDNTAKIASIARNIFPVRHESVEDAMPSPKKGRKKYSGYSLDSFRTEDEEPTPIQIYTDSHERVPEVDLSADNPFFGEQPAAVPDPVKRSSKRRKIEIAGEDDQTVEELAEREDGLLFTFRGKKTFRKFTELEAQDLGDEYPNMPSMVDDELDEELDATVPARLRGPLTRSSLKPRLLFPTPEQLAVREKKPDVTDDEEAITDIEYPVNQVSSPPEEVDEPVITPTAPKFAPATPPSTSRATRSMKMDIRGSLGLDGASDEVSPHEAHSSNLSPFDAWRRIKNGTARHGKKRGGDAITRSGGEANKRQRGGSGQAI